MEKGPDPPESTEPTEPAEPVPDVDPAALLGKIAEQVQLAVNLITSQPMCGSFCSFVLFF